MSEPEESDVEWYAKGGRIWALLSILDFTTQRDRMTKFCDEEEIGLSDFAPGHLLFLETGVRHFVNIAQDSPAVGLDSDYISDRAIRQLPTLDKVPHSTEKLDFSRNVREVQKDLREISPPYDSAIYIEQSRSALTPLLEVKKTLSENLEPVDKNLDFEQVKRDCMALSLYVAFQQSRKNLPHGYGPSNYNTWVDTGPRENSIFGYSATLQVAWSELAPDDQLDKVELGKLTESERWSPRDAWELEEEGLSNEPKTTLNSFRVKIRDSIIEKIDDRYNGYESAGSLGPDDLLETSKQKALKSYFGPLLRETDYRELEDISPSARTAFGLHWSRQVEWLGNATFSKVPLIETTLWGLAMSYSKYEDEEVPIHVTRFNHPVADEGSVVTYAILQRLPPRAVGDPSGWLIFDSVGADYEIEGEWKIRRVEDLIDNIDDLNPVKRLEIEVDRDDFIEEISPRLSDDYLEIAEANSNLMSGINSARSTIAELACAYVLARRNSDGEVFWSHTVNGEEIDAWIEKPDEIKVVETKVDLSNSRLSELTAQLERKVGAFSDNDKQVNGEVWAWEEPNDETRAWLYEEDLEYSCIQNAPEIEHASSSELKTLFEEFLPETSEKHPLDPQERFGY
ncbi:hypothetical protein HPS36_01635 [Halorubrum salinarum]|uniref:Uncharacterized protein n=1 Tax=Halorubrum salinarum TaxID=2739057 RepID=A0A7D3YC48_9EURY|nr:hypothetical protein [Halorubrum salinarum]QKG91608.1 hypothetical protein HPS36_01635 [Halorubrum salinarum]